MNERTRSAVWAVVPVKPFSQAKHRLAGVLRPWERCVLARLMLQDTLEALGRVPGLVGRLVVTADAEAGTMATQLCADVLHEARADGLNRAVVRAASAVCLRGGSSMLIVPSDVPGLPAQALRHMLDEHLRRRGPLLTLVPAHDGEGTNGWLLSPPDSLTPSFGGCSFSRHQHLAREAGVALHCTRLPGLDLDLDQPADLERYATDPAYAHTRTARFLQPRLPLTSVQAASRRPSCNLPAA